MQVNPMSKGVVTAVNVPEEDVAAFADKIRTITGKSEEENEND